MLLGEHAVLHGRRALVCAINKRITVSLSRRAENVLHIGSALGEYESPLDDLADHPAFRFVLDAVRQYPLKQGIELKIESEFPSDIGFGSSAAVTVATHAALMKNPPRLSRCSSHPSAGGEFETSPPAEGCPQGGVGSMDLMDLFKRSLATIHRVQGRSSGADVAASVFGGVIAYRADSLEIKPLGQSVSLTAVYSGSKMKTADVIKIVEDQRKSDPEKHSRIFDEMDASVDEVIDDFSILGKKLIENQFLMEEMGLCNAALAEIIRRFREQNIPAKISGSGLGDCVAGLGRVPSVGLFPVYPLEIDPQGLSCD
jgi:mevalonate kinase